ncbi:MAG: hypothetical protein IIZ36_02935 [Ruminococcus sp.]|nr:hypothetical protein [Ruminococcus sp.]
MSSDLKKLTEGLIVYSALFSDFEALDFKNDALAGIRANYFNSNRRAQRDKLEVNRGEAVYNLSYHLSEGKPLSWKMMCENHPYQTAKKEADGQYSVSTYSGLGVVVKRQFFDGKHEWIKTEFYDKKYPNRLRAVAVPRNKNGVFVIKYQKFGEQLSEKPLLLYPSDSPQSLNTTALVYSNLGMIWFDSQFIPEGEKEQLRTGSVENEGFGFNRQSFLNISKKPLAIDLANADYISKEENNSEYSEDNPGDYSAYEKIEKILTEAQKLNKDFLGVEASFNAQNQESAFDSELNSDTELNPPETANNTNGAEDNSDKADNSNTAYNSDAELIADDNSAERSDNNSLELKIEDIGGFSSYEELNRALEITAQTGKKDYSAQSILRCGKEPESKLTLDSKAGKYYYYGEVDENNLRTGRGRTVSSEGVTSYDGEHLAGKRHGFGVCYYKEGKINYAGNWNDGVRQGSGVGYRLSDGTMHAGRWSGNAPDGCGARFDSDGGFIDVSFYKNGVRDGKSVSFDENGNVVISVWKNGELISERVVTEEGE